MRGIPRSHGGARRSWRSCASFAIVLGACSSAATPAPSAAPPASSGPTAAATSAAPATASPAAPVTLNTIWMKQAAYSDDDVKAMIKAFTDANPNITVNTEFVAYEALHDKIVTAQVSGDGQYDTVLMDMPWPADSPTPRSSRTSPTRSRRTSRAASSTAPGPPPATRASTGACPGSMTRSSSSTTRRCSPTRASRAFPRPGTR